MSEPTPWVRKYGGGPPPPAEGASANWATLKLLLGAVFSVGLGIAGWYRAMEKGPPPADPPEVRNMPPAYAADVLAVRQLGERLQASAVLSHVEVSLSKLEAVVEKLRVIVDRLGRSPAGAEYADTVATAARSLDRVRGQLEPLVNGALTADQTDSVRRLLERIELAHCTLVWLTPRE